MSNLPPQGRNLTSATETYTIYLTPAYTVPNSAERAQRCTRFPLTV